MATILLVRLHPVELLSRLHSSYGFVPLVVTLTGIAAALLLLSLDTQTAGIHGVLALLRPTSPDGARSLLSAVITSMITAVSVTFSVTIVALTVAAQHFGPRVLNSFVRHTSAQLVLGLFVATFTYAVLVLGAIDDGPEAAGVPEAAVIGAVVLVICSVGGLIYYVHHVATSLQVGALAAEIATDLRTAVTRLHATSERGPDDEDVQPPEAPDDAAIVTSDETGYVQRVDFAAVATHAAARGARVWLRREPGAFVLAGAPLALVHPASAADATMVDALRQACIVGDDRTLWHDAEFAVKQLVEIALRALSPGVNEPFTAMTCIDRLSEGLAVVATVPMPRGSWRDAEGHVRVYWVPQTFGTLLRAAFDPIRISGGSNPAIYARLLDALGELSTVAHRARDREALRHQMDLVSRAGDARVSDADDRAFVEAARDRALRQHAGGVSGSRR